MGAAATTLPDFIDAAACKALCGDEFDQDIFEELARSSGHDGKVSREHLTKFAEKTDVFLTHDWGKELGMDNHARVSLVNDALKARGLRTWFDSEQMQGNIKKQMTKGIDNAQCVVVFVTKRYMEKVDGDNANDNCQLEFNYATNRKSGAKMLAVVMEDRMLNSKEWVGELGMVLGSMLYVSMTGDLSQASYLNAQADELTASIMRIIQKPVRGFPKQIKSQPAATQPTTTTKSTVDMPSNTPNKAPEPVTAVSKLESSNVAVVEPVRTNTTAADDDDGSDEPSPAVIIDLAPDGIHVGFAGDDAPRASSEYPKGSCMKDGYINNWSTLEHNLHNIFYNILRVAPEEQPVLVTESDLNPKANREKIVQLLFETFNTPAMYVSSRSTLALYASGRTIGVVCVVENSASFVAPIYEGYVLPHAVLRIDWQTAHGSGVDVASNVYNCIMKCDTDVRADFFKNVVLTGNGTTSDDFITSVRDQLNSLAPNSMTVSVIAPPERSISCWIGGSILASLSTFTEMWVSQAQYDEYGPAIVHRKCVS